MDSTIGAAIIALVGVLVGLFGRDIVMASWLARRRRQQELQDRKEIQARADRDLVRLYSDPLLESARSLRYRLDEIIEAGRAQYLLANAQKNPFNEYKRLSTLYRLAAILGWIQAFRRERSYLDPADVKLSTPENVISEIAHALADGQHVEQHRLDELLRVWRISPQSIANDAERSRLAANLDVILQDSLSAKGVLSTSDLGAQEKLDLAERCANLVTSTIKVDVPPDLVKTCADQTSIMFGIKEAYIYRDWQAAIGDLMITGVTAGPRRFDVIGYGVFETRYLDSQSTETGVGDRRWFDRLETLFHDLDMSKTGLFDARRQQVANLRHAA